MVDALRALLPAPCPGCRAPLGRARGLCAECLDALGPQVVSHSALTREVRPHLLCLGEYRGVARRAVRALKYGGGRDLAGVLAGRLATGVPAEWAPDAVVAVPLYRARRWQRGYNQAEELARGLARRLGRPYLPALMRTRPTAQQAKLYLHERDANVAGAFVARGRLPARLLVVDDVLTSASTLRACAAALRDAGAETVFYAVVAR